MQKLFSVSLLIIILSCTQQQTSQQQTITDSPAVEGVKKNETIDPFNQPTVDTTTLAGSFLISGLPITTKKFNPLELSTDTFRFQLPMAAKIEGSKLEITSNDFTNIWAEQQFKTSISIVNEGAHCDLKNFKHFYSDWQKLFSSGNDVFTIPVNEQEDKTRMVPVSGDEIRAYVKANCPEEFNDRVKNIKGSGVYPVAVGISTYFFKIHGFASGKEVVKVLAIEYSMGD